MSGADDVSSKAAARRRMADLPGHVEASIQAAQRRGDFDDLAGAGKPIEGLGGAHDPDWWLKQLVEREQIAVLPPSIQLRKDDADLDVILDGLGAESLVREAVEEFNARVIAARYGLPVGPPLVTMPRDVDATVQAWRERREARRANGADRAGEAPAPEKRSLWRRLVGRLSASWPHRR